jgi:hypothetical protein
MVRTRFIHVLALAAGLSVAACSETGSPTEARTEGPAFSAASDAARERHETLKQELEQRKADFKAEKDANKQTFEAARAEWKAWRADWKEQWKVQREGWKREHPGEMGGPDIQLLRCEPKPYEGDAAIIGPSGGTLHAGPHELVIPKGALDHEELITMEAPTSSLVDVRFEPHGLEFQRSARLSLSYKGCVRPTIAPLLVAYLGQGNRVLELLRSLDLKLDGEVEADVDHFSRYAVAY